MRLTIRTDGGARGNPGPAAAGVVILDEQGAELFAGGYYLGEGTNNVAEYTAVLRALEEAARLGGTELAVRCDSELIVKQIQGKYKVKNRRLKELHKEVTAQLGRFEAVQIEHVYRRENQRADDLVNEALDMEADVGDAVGAREGLRRSRPGGRPEVKGAAGAGGFLTKADLGERSVFNNAQPQRVLLSRGEGVFSGLVCLRAGQEHVVQARWRQATITVMRGKGTVATGQESQAVRAGWWLHVGQLGELRLTADAGEELVVLLTGQET